MAKKSKEEAEITKASILDSALKIFGRDGYNSAKLEDIAKDAGVTRGAIYHHFQNKLGVFEALMEDIANPVKGILENNVKDDPLLTLYTFFHKWLTNLEEEEKFRSVFEILFQKMDATEDEISEKDKFHHNEFVELLTKYTAQCIDRGFFYKEKTGKDCAIILDSFAIGISHLWLLLPHTFSIKDKAHDYLMSILTTLGNPEKIRTHIEQNSIN